MTKKQRKLQAERLGKLLEKTDQPPWDEQVDSWLSSLPRPPASEEEWEEFKRTADQKRLAQEVYHCRSTDEKLADWEAELRAKLE